MKCRLAAAMLAVLLFFGLSSAGALAHANLTHATIRNNQVFRVGHAPTVINGYFAENLNPDPQQTWMAVFEGVGDHGLVTEHQVSTVNFRNPKEMILRLPRLGKEKYYLIWHTKSAVDGHIAAGILYFQVR